MVLQFVFKLYGEQCEFIENGADFNSKLGIIERGKCCLNIISKFAIGFKSKIISTFP